MEAYLDNSATARTAKPVQEMVVRCMDEIYGNPSSMHRKGLEAERMVREAAQEIAATLKVDPKEIIFTSGGTESNNLALYGTALAKRRMGKHIITSAIEHASIAAPLEFLKEEGYEITELPVDHQGRILLDKLEAAIRPDTILVAVMAVNNEIGTIEPLEEMAAVIHRVNPRTVFAVDAIQAYGKLTLRPKKSGIDLLSASAHKFYGPKGVGFLYCREGVRLHPIILGGGQQRGMRSGTDNVPGVAGMGLAARLAYEHIGQKMETLKDLHHIFVEGLHEIEGVTVNGFDETTDDAEFRYHMPTIVSASFDGVRSEVLLHALEDKGVYVSAGSACSSNHPAVSKTLKAIGVPKEHLDSTVRFSFSTETTREELALALTALKELLPTLRRFSRR